MIKRIEFCGLPGSGKSTLQAVLTFELCRFSNRTVLDRNSMVDRCLRQRDDGLIKNLIKRLPGIFWKRFLSIEYALPELYEFVSANPSLMAHIFCAISRPDVSEQWRKYVLYAFFRTIVEQYLASVYLKNEIVVADEGFVHRAYTIFGNLHSDVPEDELKKFADLVPCPDVLFFIECSPESCDHRLALRPAYPLFLSTLTPEERMAQLSLGHKRLRIVVNQLEESGVAVFRIDNGEFLEQSIHQIRRHALVISEEWKHSDERGLSLS